MLPIEVFDVAPKRGREISERHSSAVVIGPSQSMPTCFGRLNVNADLLGEQVMPTSRSCPAAALREYRRISIKWKM